MAQIEPIESDVLVDLLSLVDVVVLVPFVDSWTLEQRFEAEAWAVAVHLNASDSRVKVPAKPPFVPLSETEKRLGLDARDGVCCSCGYDGDEDTPCLNRTDRVHCVHWWDGPTTEAP